MAGLLDFLQGASNEAAGAVSAPVDMIAWMLRKAGIPVPADAYGSSEWMKRKGLTRDVPQSAASLAGQTAGLLSPIGVAAKAPQIARGLLAGEEAAKRGAYVVGEKANDMAQGYMAQQGLRSSVISDGPTADRATRMQEMGLERGWFRGGPAPLGDKRTGPWYTKSEAEAAGYAKGGDVREYAIPAGGYLDAGRGYSPRLAHDVAAILEAGSYGKGGANLAKELRTFQPGEGITGGQLWQALEANLGGNDAAAAVLQQLGAFKGVKGITSPHEAYVFKNGAVRDAKKARFDPARYMEDNILASFSGATALGGTGLAALTGTRNQD